MGESSDDNLRPAIVERPALPEVSIDAFDAQCTQALLKRLRRYALLLARLPGGEHLGDPTAYAEEVVQTVATDVVAGVLRWNPAERGLEPFLIDVIRLRIRRDRKRAARHPHVSFDAARSEDLAALVDVEVNRDVMRSLRARVADDPLAVRYLDAIDRRAATRAEIMQAAQLSRTEYYKTRRRLGRLIAHGESGKRSSKKGN